MARQITLSKEMRKLKQIFKNIPEDKRGIAERQIENAAFMAVELKKLQDYISENGCTEEYKNGENQYGKKKSSEVDVYNTMIKNYTAVIKQLLDLLPDDKKEEEDALLNFISGGGVK